MHRGTRIGLTAGLAALLAAAVGPAAAQPPVAAPAAAATAAAAASAAQGKPWIPLPRLRGRLRAADLGLVINSADPDSVAVGTYYAAVRGLAPAQVLRVEVPVKPVLTRAEFDRLNAAVEAHFGPRTQALALAWQAPHAVECNSITAALAMGFDAEICRNSCGVSRVSGYFNSPADQPFAALGWRPVMMLAAPTVAQARALIDRGVAADGSLAAGRARPPVSALLLATEDTARRVRMQLYPPPGLLRAFGVDVQWLPAAELPRARRVLAVLTGSVHVPLDPPPDWVPGGLGDHLTSLGGSLGGGHGHTTALDWIAAGATATHGSVSEPCNHLQKFPHPQVLLGHYLQGATAIEAYWKSVAWPQQSLFVGEPLAAPFAPAAVAPSATPAAPPASHAPADTAP